MILDSGSLEPVFCLWVLTQQFFRTKFPAGNVVMPFVARLALVLELAAYRAHARKVFPPGPGQPAHIMGDEPGAGFQPTAVLLERPKRTQRPLYGR